MAFLTNEDYSALIRKEIQDVLAETEFNSVDEVQKLSKAEQMAISQVKNYLFGRYDTDKIFVDAGEEPDTRNPHIIMTTIDCALYHLYTSIAPNLMPEHRATRYQDALNWLRDVAKGDINADLPRKLDDAGEEKFDFRIGSERENEDNRW